MQAHQQPFLMPALTVPTHVFAHAPACFKCLALRRPLLLTSLPGSLPLHASVEHMPFAVPADM